VNISKRLVIGVFLLLIILFVGLLFWPFIFNNILTPVSLAVWVLLRIFVLSIDQKYYWGAIIFMTAFFLYRRLVPPPPPTMPAEDFQNSNEIMRTIDYWRSLLTLTDQNIQAGKTFKEELARLVLSVDPTNQRALPYYQLYKALQQGEIPIPDHIHAFLFSAESQKRWRSLKKLVQFIRSTPRRWLRRWTGQELAEHYRMINETLSFIETSLEMKNDDGKLNPNKH
jgi:hypothetical protein